MSNDREQFEIFNDRCDQCNAQAYYMVIFDSGNLYFCRHHFLANEDVLRETSYHVVDQSEILIGEK